MYALILLIILFGLILLFKAKHAHIHTTNEHDEPFRLTVFAEVARKRLDKWHRTLGKN